MDRCSQSDVRIVWLWSSRRQWATAGGYRPQIPDTTETKGCHLPVLLPHVSVGEQCCSMRLHETRMGGDQPVKRTVVASSAG